MSAETRAVWSTAFVNDLWLRRGLRGNLGTSTPDGGFVDEPPIEKSMMIGTQHHDVFDCVRSAFLSWDDVADVVRGFSPTADGADIFEGLACHKSEGGDIGVDAFGWAPTFQFGSMRCLTTFVRTVSGCRPHGRVVGKGRIARFALTHPPSAFGVRWMRSLVCQFARVVAELRGLEFMLPSPLELTAALKTGD